MARTRVPTGEPSPFNILEDQPQNDSKMRESTEELIPDDEVSGAETIGSDTSDASEDNHRVVPRTVLEDIAKFEKSFPDIMKQYRLIDRIGEGQYLHFYYAARRLKIIGTFSTVYKAEDLLYDQHFNPWDLESLDSTSYVSPSVKQGNGQQRSRRKYVAIKKIYVTSSPMRIQNELELLDDLRHCKSICPLITAFRHQDQVVAVLPYYRHNDFRVYYLRGSI